LLASARFDEAGYPSLAMHMPRSWAANGEALYGQAENAAVAAANKVLQAEVKEALAAAGRTIRITRGCPTAVGIMQA
jgi:hypothetical protein